MENVKDEKDEGECDKEVGRGGRDSGWRSG